MTRFKAYMHRLLRNTGNFMVQVFHRFEEWISKLSDRVPIVKRQALWLYTYLTYILGFRKTLIGLALFSVLLLIGSNLWVLGSTTGHMYHDADTIPYNEVGVVLGTSKYVRGSKINFYFRSRINAAVRLYKAGKIRHIIVSGDNHATNYDEPSDMREALIRRGIPAEAITCDYAGFRTLDSIVRAKKIFGQKKFTVISQKYHNHRAIFIARFYEADVVGFCARPGTTGSQLRNDIREVLARVKAVIDLYILNRQPRFLGKQEFINLSAR